MTVSIRKAPGEAPTELRRNTLSECIRTVAVTPVVVLQLYKYEANYEWYPKNVPVRAE